MVSNYPGNEHIGAFGCDPYDISGTVDKEVLTELFTD
jgi:hypothetical protein